MSCAPTISVIMPVYNAQHYLRDAIDSILAQPFNDFEFLIIDDGSADGSVDIIHSYADSRIRLLCQPHQGLVRALNKGLDHARAGYLARQDADDISARERLAKQVAYLQGHSETILVGCWSYMINSHGNATGAHATPPSGGKRLSLGLCAGNQFVHGSVMMRRDAVLSVGGYRAAFGTAEDYDLWLRLAEVGELANLSELLYGLRVHADSVTASAGPSAVRGNAVRAQRSAVERYIHRQRLRDQALSAMPVARALTNPDHPSAMDFVSLSDWAQIYLWQHHFCFGRYLLLRALIASPWDARTWSLIRQCYMSRGTLRVTYEVLRHIIAHQRKPSRTLN